MIQERIAGAAVSTPLTNELAIDHECLVEHVSQLRQRGVDVLTLFGTTGEGASFSRAERAHAIERCATAGIEPNHLGSGIFGLTSHDTSEDCKQAFASGCGHVLLAPPCFYKGVNDEGLYRWFSEVIESAGPGGGNFVLYHIPAMTTIELSVALVTRLAAKFPELVVGVKDSSGNWPHTERLIQSRGALKILIGHEGFLERGMKTGASGAIAGSANVIPEVIKTIVHDDSAQPNLPVIIDTLLQYPVVPAVKGLIAHRLRETAWLRVRPPLTALAQQQVEVLGKQLDELFPA